MFHQVNQADLDRISRESNLPPMKAIDLGMPNTPKVVLVDDPDRRSEVEALRQRPEPHVVIVEDSVMPPINEAAIQEMAPHSTAQPDDIPGQLQRSDKRSRGRTYPRSAMNAALAVAAVTASAGRFGIPLPKELRGLTRPPVPPKEITEADYRRIAAAEAKRARKAARKAGAK